jgi:hypothetical protein
MILIANNFETFVPPRNLGLSRKKVNFSPGNNYVPGEKEFKLPEGTT